MCSFLKLERRAYSEAGALAARIPRLIDHGRLERAAGVKVDLQRSRIMVCGNPGMARELRAQLTTRGFQINRRATPGQLAFENYWQVMRSRPER